MRKLILFFLLLCINKTFSQQSLNWGEVLYGDMQNFNKNKIKSLKLKSGDRVVRSINVISENSILVKDSLNTQFIYFDDENRMISVKSIKDNWQQQFSLNFKDDCVNQLSKTIDNNGRVVVKKFSKVSFKNALYEEREVYSFENTGSDSLNVFRTKYFFNPVDADLSYKETYYNGKIWTKKYFNHSEVKKEKFDGHFTVDSIIQKDNKVTKYHFDNYPEQQIIEIVNDSILTIHKKNGKKISEKLVYANLPFKEIFYDENENVKEKIIYQNYQSSFNDWILWEVVKYNSKGKLISRNFPNKSIYTLKDKILYFRKNMNRVNTHDYLTDPYRKKDFHHYEISLYSSSILFCMKTAKDFIKNFDYSIVDEDDEVVYTKLEFSDNAVVNTHYSASKLIEDELIRASKSIRKKDGYLSKYFGGMEVEAETSAGEIYRIKLSQNPEILFFPIHIFLIKEE